MKASHLAQLATRPPGLARAARWLAYPYIRYWIAPNHWLSIWLHWGWYAPGLFSSDYQGTHRGISLGCCLLVHSRNCGQPVRP